MGTDKRGFAAMDPTLHRALASKGGKAAHARGTSFQWTPDEAVEAGRKGGLKSAALRAARKQAASPSAQRVKE